MAIRLLGTAGLPWASGEWDALGASRHDWLGATPMAARLLALAIGVATVPIGYALARPGGRAPAFALALLLAASPWHVHASRVAGLGTLAFLVVLVASRALVSGATFRGRPLVPFLAGLAVWFGGVLWLLRPGGAGLGVADSVGERRSRGIVFLAADLGVTLPWLAAIGFLRRGARTGALAALLVGLAGAAAASSLRELGLFPASIALAAWLLPPLFVLAADELGRWIAATSSVRARIAFALIAVVPGLPALVSEQMDGERFDLAPLARAFAEVRRGGEPLYASDPLLASRALGVEARPLADLVNDSNDRLLGTTAYVLLLLERGQVQGAPRPSPEFESRLESELELLARSGAKRIDPKRFEARLYRRPADSRAP